MLVVHGELHAWLINFLAFIIHKHCRSSFYIISVVYLDYMLVFGFTLKKTPQKTQKINGNAYSTPVDPTVVA